MLVKSSKDPNERYKNLSLTQVQLAMLDSYAIQLSRGEVDGKMDRVDARQLQKDNDDLRM